MQPTVYQIPSSDRLGVVHTVTVHADGRTDCTCEDATYRRRQCKHQRQVLAGAIPQPPGARAAELAEQYAAIADLQAVRDIISGGW